MKYMYIWVKLSLHIIKSGETVNAFNKSEVEFIIKLEKDYWYILKHLNFQTHLLE